MLRIFVTGDNHIGLKYASHEKASTLSECRLTAFESMVKNANEEHCDLFVITGDLFENTYGISKRDIKTLLDMLCYFNGTVVVLPGNHDYHDNEVKVWQNFKEIMETKDNILLLTEYRPYTVDVAGKRVAMYPALCTSLHSLPGQNNLEWIKNTNLLSDSEYHIGIAHGAVEGETIDKEGQYFLMRREELEDIPMDAWLIGHTHVPFPRDLTDEFTKRGKIFNAGTHVQTDVSCNTTGQCFIIEIDESKEIRAKKIESGNIYFYRKYLELTSGEMQNILKRELDDICDNSVVDLIISGAVTDEEYENRLTVIETALSRFIEGNYNDSALSKIISKELIEKEFPQTSFSAGLLSALLKEPKEAQLVYEMLKSLKGDK